MMTREEAIKHLRNDWFMSLGGQLCVDEDKKDAFLEAVGMGIKALRPVSREQVEKVWSPCNFCAGAKYITGGVTAVYPLSETRQQETLAEGDFDFCPVCGRPITDEAVDMVMERLGALNDAVSTTT